MTVHVSTAAPTFLRRLLPAVLLAAASIALGGFALADPATAVADREWDVAEYDQCIERGGLPVDCCFLSGGDWSSGPLHYCVAPPADQSAEPEQTGPRFTVTRAPAPTTRSPVQPGP
jgi:hypothetical protein